MKILATLTALLLSTGIAAAASNASTKAVLDATYKLYMGDRGVCSGQMVKDTQEEDLYLTANHCLGNATVEQLKTFNIRKEVLDEKFRTIKEEIYYLDVVRTAAKKDLILLKLRDAKASWGFVNIATEEDAKALTNGTPVMVVGYPKGLDLTVTNGLWTGLVPSPIEDLIDSPLQRATAPVTYGSSGGGLYLERDGTWYLIGVTSAKWPDTEFMNYFSTVKELNAIVKNFITVPQVNSTIKQSTVDTQSIKQEGDGPEVTE